MPRRPNFARAKAVLLLLVEGQSNGDLPTYRELAEAVGCSVASVHRTVVWLQSSRLVSHAAGRARSLRPRLGGTGAEVLRALNVLPRPRERAPGRFPGP